jgi:hypothetical protein
MELASRMTNGVHVSLEAIRPGRVAVYVSDRLSGRGFRFEVPAERALDAFHHPFKHGAKAGFDPLTYRATRGPLI